MSELTGEPNLTARAGFLSQWTVSLSVLGLYMPCGVFRRKVEVTAAQSFYSCVFAEHLLC